MSLEVLFTLLSVVALASAGIKVVILAQVATTSRITSAFNLVAVTMICYNITEALTYWFYHSNPQLAAITLDLLLFSGIAIGYSMVSFVAEVTENPNARDYRLGFAVFGAGVTALHALGYISEGIQEAGYSVVTIKGPLYPAFSAFIISMVIVCLFLLVKGCQHKKYVVQLHSKLTLVATSLFFSAALTIMILKLLGYNASSGGVLPVATCAYLFLLMYGEKGDDAIVTFSMKWIRVWFYFRLAIDSITSKDQLGFEDFEWQMEKQIVLRAMKYCRNNKTKVARLLVTNTTKLNRILAKIKEEELKAKLAANKQLASDAE